MDSMREDLEKKQSLKHNLDNKDMPGVLMQRGG